jgi:TRAP-type C4-dicarboxylate transport system permease large subunit
MIFMKSLQKSGMLDGFAALLLRTFYRHRLLLLFSMMLLAMFPGMITGSSTTAVLTTGALAAPVLMKMGLDHLKTAAFIAMAGILGMIAPPVNILVMIMGAGVDMPYVGLTLPLLAIVIPLAIIFTLWIGSKGVKSLGREELKEIISSLPVTDSSFRLYVPLIIVVILLLAQSISLPLLSQLGLPLIFLIGSLVSWILHWKKMNFFLLTQDALREALPILSILVGVGMFIQIMTLTGGRGWTVLTFLSLPPALLYLGMAISMPLFGAVSAFGSASILGVPFILALINTNAIITSSALSAIAGLGDLMPPTALAGMFAAQVVGEKKYFRVLRHCLIPALFELIFALGFLLAGPFFDKIF